MPVIKLNFLNSYVINYLQIILIIFILDKLVKNYVFSGKSDVSYLYKKNNNFF